MFTGQRNIVQSQAKKYCPKDKKCKAEQRNTVQSRAKKYCTKKERKCSGVEWQGRCPPPLSPQCLSPLNRAVAPLAPWGGGLLWWWGLWRWWLQRWWKNYGDGDDDGHSLCRQVMMVVMIAMMVMLMKMLMMMITLLLIVAPRAVWERVERPLVEGTVRWRAAPSHSHVLHDDDERMMLTLTYPAGWWSEIILWWGWEWHLWFQKKVTLTCINYHHLSLMYLC